MKNFLSIFFKLFLQIDTIYAKTYSNLNKNNNIDFKIFFYRKLTLFKFKLMKFFLVVIFFDLDMLYFILRIYIIRILAC